ncbi:response regulator transcription factor [Ruminococcus difficilis]|uniref:Stage 0 sporulation protein A homolog n=1 Tax=Ruminococcus difficilis TaxID=2763069 RepID=A0A934WS29_9FIRM|nr:response regulator transcription factor [Ruminococcus difficilis]MBK6088898.1 response regulator transcription factor [Ruminococcus difficilis]
MSKLLIVDDEFRIRELIKKYAIYEGHEVDEAEDGEQAVLKCRNNEYDLIIMDIMMPVMDGFEAVSRLRRFTNTPVIMLSAKGEEYDRLTGFEVGVDDYVVKPFSPKELMMRVGAVLRRSGTDKKDDGKSRFTYKGLSIDFAARVVTVDGERVQLTPREYELLFYMVNNKGIALTREQLISKVWGYDFFGDDRTLDTHIKLLRKSLGEYASLIVTLRGVGYRFET